MAWSEKAVDDAVTAYWQPPMDNEHSKRMRAALDAAAAVDGDAQWNAAIEVAAQKAERSSIFLLPFVEHIARKIRSLKRG